MSLTAMSFGGCKTPTPDPIDDNYRTFYQVFVGSFSDGNGDGIGDLRGVINRFDYLNNGDVNSKDSLNVQGIWLSPIFSSPSYHKYDATDYYEVDWRFGSLEDLKELIALCNERETGCRGAASLSAWALTGEALPAPEILQVIECNKANHQIYNEKFAKWKVFSSQIRSLSKWQS